MSILRNLLETVDGDYLKSTTVHNYHRVDLWQVAQNKNSSLHGALKSVLPLIDKGVCIGVFRGAIGRSQHGPTDLHIFQLESDYHGQRLTLTKELIEKL